MLARSAPAERPSLAASHGALGAVSRPSAAGAARCLYLDLDSTLLGRGASLLHDGEGNVTIDGVRAVQACLRAGVEVVLMSGRRRAQVMEDARLLGQSSYIYEAGACVVLDGEEHWLTGELLPGELTIAEQIERSGAPALLLERYSGRLEYHEPWHVAARGLPPVPRPGRRRRGRRACWPSTATRTCGWSTTASSTGARRRSRGCRTCAATTWCRPEPRRSAAVALHRRARGYERAETFAVGDSREDLACAAEVDAFWLVANALERDPSMREAIAGHANVRVCEAGHGRGVYEAVVSTLMATP